MREKGLASFSASFEPQMAMPLDARQLVSTVSDLTSPVIWTANDGGNYTYIGMVVSVHSDPIPENNTLYRLKALPYTNINNWEKVGGDAGVVDTTTIIYSLSSANGQYLSLSGMSFQSPMSGFRMPKNGIIRNLTIYSTHGEDRKIYLKKNNTIFLLEIDYSNITGYNDDVNITLSAGDIIQVFVENKPSQLLNVVASFTLSF